MLKYEKKINNHDHKGSSKFKLALQPSLTGCHRPDKPEFIILHKQKIQK